MKPINGILYLEYAEYVPDIVSDRTYKNQRNEEENPIRTLTRGGAGNKVLIEWESIPAKYRLKYQKHRCEGRCDKCRKQQPACDWNPYEAAANQSLRERLSIDYQARQYYTDFRFFDGNALTPRQIEQFTTAISWLNLLQELSGNTALIKRDFGLSILQFWSKVGSLIKEDGVRLPHSYKRLRIKIEEYATKSYDVMIGDKFGIKNAAKVKDEVSKALLLEMIDHPHQFDDVYICEQYNRWALANGYKPIDASTVGVHRRRHEHSIKFFREGMSEYNRTHNLSIPRNRPSQPLYQINSDDNNLDIFFTNIAIKDNSKHFQKLVLIVVMDSYNDYVLGYSWQIASSPVVKMVHAAYLDAAYHVKQLTGSWHMWHEIRTDRWALKSLQPFYEKQAFFNPQGFKNAKSKLIEQAFGHDLPGILKKVQGYTGHNITAAHRGVNPDHQVANRQNQHEVEEAGVVVDYIMKELRNLPGKRNKKITREQEWLDAWAAMPDKDKRSVSDEFILSTFGTPHSVRDLKYPNEITNNGVKVQINNVKYQYLPPPTQLQQLIGTSVRVMYDGIDMSRVLLVNEDRNVRVMAHTFVPIPGAAKDFGEGDRSRFNMYLDIKRQNIRQITEEQIERRDKLKEAGIDEEYLLQMGSVNFPKEQAKRAELAYEIRQLELASGISLEDEDEDPINQM